LLLSVVTPVFNEEQTVEACYEEVRRVLLSVQSEFDYEHIFCDNYSSDTTLAILTSLAEKDRKVKVVAYSRNFGPFNSVFNGMLAAGGDLVVPFVPADLQDPPAVILEFLEKWRQGFDVVYGKRTNRQEPWLMRSFRTIYYKLVSSWANIQIPTNVGEFTLLTRQVVDSISQVDDYYPYLRGLIANAGFRFTTVSYTWEKRGGGRSKNNFFSLLDQGLNGLISFSKVPMRLMMLSGAVISSISILYSIYSLVLGLLFYQSLAQPGIQTLIVATFFLSGVVLFSLGLVGEYVAAIHAQVRKRPLVIERFRINF
jgi:polyisoprenyl-phosphate glycosyltransferase